MVKHILHNPVYHALCTGDQPLSFGTDQVKYFNEEVSPFVGFEDQYKTGFADLYELLPHGRKILYANPEKILQPPGWQLNHEIKGLQFIHKARGGISKVFDNLVSLSDVHINQMIELAMLTKPGPFGQRTIDFGQYYGIFDQKKLVAMTGQRLHIKNYTEISAVCTHPDYTGKGYAYALMQQQIQLILQQEKTPFLHVREDNLRAIALYQRMGFVVSRPMNFYFMKRQ